MKLNHTPSVQFSHHLTTGGVEGYEGNNFVRKWTEEIAKVNDCFFVVMTATYKFPRRQKSHKLNITVNTVRWTVSVGGGESLRDDESELFRKEFGEWCIQVVREHLPVLRAHVCDELRASVQRTVDAVLTNLKPVQDMLADQGKAP